MAPVNVWYPHSRVKRVDLPALAGGAHRIPELPSHNAPVSNTNHSAPAPSHVVFAVPV
jgi:hypothetical protein